MFFSRVQAPFYRLLPGAFAFASLVACLTAGSALAQSPAVQTVDGQAAVAQTVQTQPSATAATPSQSAIGQPQATAARSDAIDQQIADFTQDPAARSVNAAPAAPRQIHGEAGVAFGSSGYRSGYIATDIPIGRNSDLGIAVGETDFKPRHYGEIRNRSLAISLNIGGGSNGAPVSCASPTVAMDGRYLEPVWVSRLHGEALARDQAGCGGPDYRGPVDGGETDSGE